MYLYYLDFLDFLWLLLFSLCLLVTVIFHCLHFNTLLDNSDDNEQSIKIINSNEIIDVNQ